MVTKVLSGAISGVDCIPIWVEVDVANGLPCIDMIGLLGTEVKEAKERVRVALKNMGITLPPIRITINLSPANIRKDGTAYDLPIAIAVLTGLGEIKTESVNDIMFAGEIGLNGEVKRIDGILPIALEARRLGVKYLMIPNKNAPEGAVVEGLNVIGVSSLKEAMEYLNTEDNKRNQIIEPFKVDVKSMFDVGRNAYNCDFVELAGQESLKRAMMIAAAGFHNILMIGAPGSGKTMAARRLSTIMPPLTIGESMEVSKIYSVSGLLGEHESMILKRPFVNPHHTISDTAMSGGGRIPKPGIISRAHKGVLFLDEAVHFSTASLEILRQPIEDKEVVVSRTYGTYKFPAEFMLCMAINPCPCGNYPDVNNCTCTPEQIRRYLGKLSGPILDRIDICVEAPKISVFDLNDSGKCMTSLQMRRKVIRACDIQKERYKAIGKQFNSQLGPKEIEEFIVLGEPERKLVEEIYEKMNLSMRGYHRILKVARTIADVEEKERINRNHIMEAVCYRGIEDKYWGI